MIIGIVNQKGGTGKTTLAINLADAFARHAQRVLLVDADPQASVNRWHMVKNNARFDINTLRNEDLPNVVKTAAVHYDRIFVDTPPSVCEITEAIICLSDLVIVPIGPSPLDIWSSKDIVNMVRKARTAGRDFNVNLLIYRTIVGTRLSKAARSTLQGFGIALFGTQISQRVAFIESMIAGQSVLEYAPESAAAREIESLRREITSLFI